MKEASDLHGRRGRDLHVPVQWEDEGFYQVRRLATGEIALFHRFRNVFEEIPEELMPQESCAANLVVKANYSERRAALYVKGDGPFIANCTEIIAMPVLAVVLRGGKKRRLMGMLRPAIN